MTLRIGRFSYSNLFPIFYMLENRCDCSGYEFIEGVPSELNRMLRDGELDISPSSSIEFLRYPDRYDYIDGHSISSNGPVGSILLFSKKKLKALDRCTIMTTHQSDTSVAMLHIILSKFNRLNCIYRKTDEPIEKVLKHHDAYLLIGDDALSEALKWQKKIYIYDLGRIWADHTGMPFTYALWLIRRQSRPDKHEEIKKFINDLGTAKQSALADLRQIAKKSPLIAKLDEDDLVEYWQKMIDYDFTAAHLKGLSLFKYYCMELGLL